MSTIQRTTGPRFANVRRGSRSGYTLLELLLSLALTVIVLAGIATAISVFYEALTGQQRAIEQDLVGRSILNMMANDLRAGLQYKAADVSGIENLAVSEALIAGLMGGGGGAPTGAGGGTGQPDDEEEGEDEGGDEADDGAGGAAATGQANATAEEEPDPAEEDNAWYRPSFVGTGDTFTIDISRLPRLDQYSALTNDLAATSTPSDIKRIAWLVALNPSTSADPNSIDPVGDTMGGLFRREVDRAVSAYRQEPDTPPGPDEYTRLMAPEIVSLQFRYWDGTNWLSEWQSSSIGGYPLAVEITLLLDPDRTPNVAASPSRGEADVNLENTTLYRTVVHLPVAEIMPEEGAGE
jgi:type II secretory pathway pseudopilin PulG